METGHILLVATFALFVAPGPTNALLFAAGGRRGLFGAVFAALAVLAAYVIAVAGARLFLGPVLATSDAASRAVKLALGCYVLWLAVRLWRVGRAGAGGATAPSYGALFTTTLLNPKALVLAFVLLPAGDPPPAAATLVSAAAILVASFLWLGLGAGAQHALGARNESVIARCSAVALAVFGGLAVSAALA